MMSRSISTNEGTDTTVTTIGRAVIVQSIIRYGAIILLAWLALNFADAWIMAAIEKVAG